MLAISAFLLLAVSFVGKHLFKAITAYIACKRASIFFSALNAEVDDVYQTYDQDVVLGEDGVVNKLECNLTLPVVFFMKKKGERNVSNETTVGPLNRDFKQIEKIEGATLYFEQDKLSMACDSDSEISSRVEIVSSHLFLFERG